MKHPELTRISMDHQASSTEFLYPYTPGNAYNGITKICHPDIHPGCTQQQELFGQFHGFVFSIPTKKVF